MEQIIDFEKRGNVVRFLCGTEDAWGDDWDDRPYEHNAGRAYDEYVTRIIDVAFSFDCFVTEPADDWHFEGNSPFSKEDFKKRKAPCILVAPPELSDFLSSYTTLAGSDQVTKFYFGDSVNVLLNCANAVIMLDERKEVVS